MRLPALARRASVGLQYESGADAPVDGVAIGPILTRMGADGGVSLATSRMGFDNIWTASNPVMGHPDGVVAIRIGSGSGGFGQFVRIGDTRDPDLAGNLSAAGNLSISGTTTLTGPADMKAGAVSSGQVILKDADGNDCITFLPNGKVNLTCRGELKARQGLFTDGTPTNATTVGPDGVSATGKVSGADVVASKSLSGERLVLSDVSEGAACGAEAGAPAGSAYAGLAGGGLAMCSGGHWVAVGRFRAAGSACTAAEEGSVATDPAAGPGLRCAAC